MTSTQQFAPAPNPDLEERVEFEDYWGFEEKHTFTLPDGKQQIFFQSLNEGAKTKFQKATNKDIHLNRQTQDARIKTDPAGERHELILASVTGWTLVKKNANTGAFEPVPFSTGSPGSQVGQWLQVANPVIVDALEEAIRKANPWMMDDMSTEQIDKEIERLYDLRKQVEERQNKQAAFQS